MEFIDKDVAKRFDCLAEADVIKNTGSYSGPLSKIDLATAEFLVKTGDSNIKEKDKTPKPSAPATPATK